MAGIYTAEHLDLVVVVYICNGADANTFDRWALVTRDCNGLRSEVAVVIERVPNKLMNRSVRYSICITSEQSGKRERETERKGLRQQGSLENDLADGDIE